jgi:FkbM family methyltransferase
MKKSIKAALSAAQRPLLRAATKVLKSAGFDVMESRYSSAYLRRFNFKIATLVDIGVYKGTPVFYELFRGRQFVLIDPLPGAAELVSIGASEAVEFVEEAAGARAGEVSLNLAGPNSSLQARLKGKAPVERVTVPVRPLDEIMAGGGYPPPFGIKIDTEGFEIEVIKGATETLKRSEFVFAEASTRRRFAGGYAFSELIAEMARHGFEPAEIIPHHAHNRRADVLFVRADSRHLDAANVKVRIPGQR